MYSTRIRQGVTTIMADISTLNVRTTIVLPKALKARAFELSEKTGAPFAVIVRRALESHLNMEADLAPKEKAA